MLGDWGRFKVFIRTAIVVSLAAPFLVTQPARATCLFSCDEITQKTAFTALKPGERVDHRKLITYEDKELKKVVSKTTTDDALFNFFSGQEYTAQIYSLVYLGADLSALEPAHVTASDCHILSSECIVTVKLPPIEVISTELDLHNSVIVHQSEGILVSKEMTATFIQNMFAQHKKQIEAEAIGSKDNVAAARRNLMSALKDIILKEVGDGTSVVFTSDLEH